MAVSELSGGLWHIEPLWGELEELLGVHLPSSAEAWVRVVPRAMPRQAAHRKDRLSCMGTTRIIPWSKPGSLFNAETLRTLRTRRERQEQGGWKKQGSALAQVARGGSGDRGGKIRPGCARMHKAEPYATRVDHVRHRGGGVKSTSAGCHSASQRMERHRTVAL